MRFDRFYPGASNCAIPRHLPDRTYPPRHRVYIPQGLARGGTHCQDGFQGPYRGEDERYHTFLSSINQAPAEFVTLAAVLREVGYATARLGKWHIGDVHQGFI